MQTCLPKRAAPSFKNGPSVTLILEIGRYGETYETLRRNMNVKHAGVIGPSSVRPHFRLYLEIPKVHKVHKVVVTVT